MIVPEKPKLFHSVDEWIVWVEGVFSQNNREDSAKIIAEQLVLNYHK